MPEFDTNDWTKYKIDFDKREFDTVTHVTHIPIAVDIFRAGKIKPDLIYDESRLNTERIRVIWISPNDWGDGFRYGNIGYALDWAKLIAGKNLYWVGMMEYKPLACRILITDQDRSNLLKPYVPTNNDGPWYFDQGNGKHYRNGTVNLEFMFEGEILLDDVSELIGVRHNPNQCCIDAYNCPYRGWDSQSGQRFVLAELLGRHIALPQNLFAKDGENRYFTYAAWSPLYRFFDSYCADNSVVPADVVPDIVRTILLNFALKKKDSWQRLCNLISKEDGTTALGNMIAQAIGIDPAKLFDDGWL